MSFDGTSVDFRGRAQEGILPPGQPPVESSLFFAVQPEVEFLDKKDAKRAADMGNSQPIGGKKRSQRDRRKHARLAPSPSKVLLALLQLTDFPRSRG